MGLAALVGYWAIVVAAVLFVTSATQKWPVADAVGVDTTPEESV